MSDVGSTLRGFLGFRVRGTESAPMKASYFSACYAEAPNLNPANLEPWIEGRSFVKLCCFQGLAAKKALP